MVMFQRSPGAFRGRNEGIAALLSNPRSARESSKFTRLETNKMFKKILIANRGVRALGAAASAANCMVAGAAGRAGEFTPGAKHV
jgi:hypothetical protein